MEDDTGARSARGAGRAPTAWSPAAAACCPALAGCALGMCTPALCSVPPCICAPLCRVLLWRKLGKGPTLQQQATLHLNHHHSATDMVLQCTEYKILLPLYMV